MPEQFQYELLSPCNPSPGCHAGGPIQPIGITWVAAGVNDEGWNVVPGCIHTAMHRDVLPGCLLLLVYISFQSGIGPSPWTEACLQSQSHHRCG